MSAKTLTPRGAVPFARLLVAAASLCACSGPAPAPAEFAVERYALRERTIARVVASQCGDAPDGVAAAAGAVPSGSGTAFGDLAASVALLDAVAERDREARVALLERIAGADIGPIDAPVAAKVARHLLESDDAYLAQALEQDRVYSVAADAFNGVLEMGTAALNGNPIGVLRPVFGGVDRLVGKRPADPRRRKLAALHERLAVHVDRDSGNAPDAIGTTGEVLDTGERVRLQREVAALRRETFDDEVWLARDRLAAGAIDAAAAHVLAAAAVDARAPEVAELRAALEQAAADDAARLARALQVDDSAARLGWVDPAAADAQADVIADVQRGRAADPAAAGEMHPSPAAAGRRAWHDDPFAAVDAARDDHARRTRRFVFLGEKPARDPLARYAAARQARTWSLLDVLEPILWVPATIVRGACASFGDPVGDQELRDALARAAAAAPDDPRAAGALEELAERRGERASDGAVNEDGGASGAGSVDSSGRASAEPLGVPLPPLAVQPFARTFGIDERWVDGRRGNGEVASGGLTFLGDRLRVKLDDADAAAFEIPLDDPARARATALAAEWSWRRRAIAARSYADLHDGVPVEFSMGVGLDGFHVLPRLLPEDYRAADRVLWE